MLFAAFDPSAVVLSRAALVLLCVVAYGLGAASAVAIGCWASDAFEPRDDTPGRVRADRRHANPSGRKSA